MRADRCGTRDDRLDASDVHDLDRGWLRYQATGWDGSEASRNWQAIVDVTLATIVGTIVVLMLTVGLLAVEAVSDDDQLRVPFLGDSYECCRRVTASNGL